jgi:hypothetical protein
MIVFHCPGVASSQTREAIMEGLVQAIDGLAIQYWMLWATTAVGGFVAWEIWSSMRHR